MSVGIQVTRLVTFVVVMCAWLFRRARRGCTFVAVAVRVQIARDMAFVRVMRAGLFGGLVRHESLLESFQRTGVGQRST